VPDFLPIGLQDIMHRWQSGLPKVGRQDSPLSQWAEGLISKLNEPQRRNAASAAHKAKTTEWYSFVSFVPLWFNFFPGLTIKIIWLKGE
jgi:hypothetical protein